MIFLMENWQNSELAAIRMGFGEGLVNIAKKNNIPYQCEIMSGSTGTNADVISLCESGIKGALISIPEKYMHQPCEVVDVNDIESVSNLIYAYISEKAGEPNA